ncbi:MAG: hypothetical protein PVI97_14990 [Candidatus Thiodiazotropha sp.]|jgi:hypothetical protein
MNLERAPECTVRFGFGIASEVDAHLQRAAHLVSRREASLCVLRDAYEVAPDQVDSNLIPDLLSGLEEESRDG